MSNLKTASDGASDERRLLMRKARHFQGMTNPNAVAGTPFVLIGRLISYGLGRAKRCKFTTGGLHVSINTVAQGASEERRMWLRKINEALLVLPKGSPAEAYFSAMKEYIQGRTKRNNAKPGGQGWK